jgi:hypothetical protein
MTRIANGEYVLATKYTDGDPGDEWAVGFLHHREGGRYYVVDGGGIQFRGNGFRRIQRLTPEVGERILMYRDTIERSRRSLWWWKAGLSKQSTVPPCWLHKGRLPD